MTTSDNEQIPIAPDEYDSGAGKKFSLFLLVVSIIACWSVQEFITGTITMVGHIAWLIFHIAYITGFVVLDRKMRGKWIFQGVI